jgi:hypothetical protein
MASKRKTIKQLVPTFETKQQAAKRHAQMSRALQRDDGRGARIAEQWAALEVPLVPDPLEEDARAKKLAEQLARCANSRPCNLSICPICLRRLRESFILGAVTCIQQLGLGPELPIIEFSAVSVRNSYSLDCLDRIDLRKIKKRIRDQHKRAGFPLAFAGVEILLNEMRQRHEYHAPFWQAQVHGVVVGLEIDDVESAVKREYPSEASIPMPLSLSECSNLAAAALDSAVNPEFVRNDGSRNTRLKKSQLKEVGLWVSLHEPKVRYVLTGCHFDGTQLELKRGVRRHLNETASTRHGGSN